MPQQPINEARFNQILQRVVATAPEGLSEEQFNRLLDRAIQDESGPPRISTLDDAWLRTQEPDMRERGAEFAAQLPAAGGAVGSLAGGVPGAAVGGALGALGRDLMFAGRGDPRAPRSGGEAAGNVGLNAGGQAVLSKGGELFGRGLVATGNAITKRAVPLVRSALKQPMAELRRRAGIEGIMPTQAANRQAQFVIDRQLSNPEQAQALNKMLGGKVDTVVSHAETANPALAIDSAERIPRYLSALLRRIDRQILPGKDRAAVQNVGRELVEDSPLSRSTLTPRAPETLEQGLACGAREGADLAENAGRLMPRPSASPQQFTGPGGSFPRSSRPRELRTDVKPSEALEIVRNKSFFDPAASGASVAGGKTIERAVRDGVKAAVPETAPLLRDQGRAIDAERILDRTMWRDANRDTAGLGATMGVASGRPLMGLLLQMVKEGGLRTGLAAGKYGPKIARSGSAAGVSAEQLARAIQALMQDEP